MTKQEFGNVLISYKMDLERFALHLSRNYEDATDLVQDSFYKALKYRDMYKDGTNFKAWAFTIMRNTYINKYNRKMNSPVQSDNDYDTVRKKQDTELSRTYVSADGLLNEKWIYKTMDSLNEELAIPFKMYVDGYKYKEIAEQLNIHIGTVKSRIHTARRKLQNMLEI